MQLKVVHPLQPRITSFKCCKCFLDITVNFERFMKTPIVVRITNKRSMARLYTHCNLASPV